MCGLVNLVTESKSEADTHWAKDGLDRLGTVCPTGMKTVLSGIEVCQVAALDSRYPLFYNDPNLLVEGKAIWCVGRPNVLSVSTFVVNFNSGRLCYESDACVIKSLLEDVRSFAVL
jgi:hypothetical protein